MAWLSPWEFWRVSTRYCQADALVPLLLAHRFRERSHKIIQIWILDKENKTLLEEKNRTALRVGDQLPLQVMASWAIPYVGEVTDKARLTVNDPTLGELDSKGVFTAKRPGQIAIEAVVRVVRSSGEDQLLDPTDQAPAGTPITEFRSQIELTITN